VIRREEEGLTKLDRGVLSLSTSQAEKVPCGKSACERADGGQGREVCALRSKRSGCGEDTESKNLLLIREKNCPNHWRWVSRENTFIEVKTCKFLEKTESARQGRHFANFV